MSQGVLLCSAEKTSTGYSLGEIRATSEADVFDFFFTDLIGAEMWAESHFIDLQSSAADRWLQGVIKGEDMGLCPQNTARAWGLRDNTTLIPETHPVIFSNSPCLDLGIEHTHILLC